ncbi:DUF2232 domain-containing protein [Fusibacter ferrireducens]|uniref:DUF2232 domain-containing protein n=1 Tax=Fusibacter ferrireducens TaxID=2785058 RepID=A0ABR9ZYF0_9FIRM|nr:DUF2232 domain-containing protein [Fusibacter ferrireducens]MBF4695480.1 DUF2232 domain-containing protein [Fusibacter ferrireducens]
MKNTRQITEAGLFAAILVIFIIGSFYIPVIGGAIFFIAPLPVIILSIRNTALNVVVSCIVSALLSSLLVSFSFGFSVGMLALGIGLPMGLAIKRFEPPLKAMAIGTLGAFVALILIFGLMNFILGISTEQTIDEMFSMSKDIQAEIDKTIESYSTTLSPEQQTQIKMALGDSSETMDNMVELLKLLMPASLLLMSISLAMVNYRVSISFLKRLKMAHRPLGSFTTFTYPKHMAYGSAGMLLGAYVLGSMGVVDMTTAMLNFIYLFIMIFYIQGLAVGYFFLRRSISKGVSITILVLVSLLGLINYIALIGFMDVLLDVRRLQPKKR